MEELRHWDEVFTEVFGGGIWTQGIYVFVREIVNQVSVRVHSSDGTSKTPTVTWAQMAGSGGGNGGSSGGGKAGKDSDKSSKDEQKGRDADDDPSKPPTPTGKTTEVDPTTLRLGRIRILMNPHLPFTNTEVPQAAFFGKEKCLDQVKIYHGCRLNSFGDAQSFNRNGVKSSDKVSYYSRDATPYWSTSSVFAIWWAARGHVTTLGVDNGIERRPELSRAEIGGRIPDNLRDVPCIVTAAEIPKDEIYPPDDKGRFNWWIIRSLEEEDDVCTLLYFEILNAFRIAN